MTTNGDHDPGERYVAELEAERSALYEQLTNLRLDFASFKKQARIAIEVLYAAFEDQ